MKVQSILATLLFAATAWAGEAIRGIGDVVTIEDEEGHGRVLFQCDDLIETENVAIWKAMLRFELLGQGESRTLPIVIHPITRPWSPGSVDWETGWTRPGGDIDEQRFARAELNLARGAGQYSIDVTALAKEIVESGYVCYGFLATIDRSQGIGFANEDLGRFANLGNASIEVSYRTTPPPPRAVSRT